MKSTKVTFGLLIIYLLILFWILLFKMGAQFSYMSSRNVNLLPFDGFTRKLDKAEIILNVLIFTPLGIYMGVLCRKWGWIAKFICFAFISLIIESLQYIFRIGAFDITDIVTNTSGGIVGFLLYNLLENLFRSRAKSQAFINVAATIGTLIMISLLILLKLKMLPIRYQ